MWRCALALAALQVTHACPFAEDTSGSLPPNHPEIGTRRQLQGYGGSTAPDATVPDVAGGIFKIPPGGITTPRGGYGGQSTAFMIDAMAKKSVKEGKGALCYWSWQSLPPPTDAPVNKNWGARGKFDFAEMEKHHAGSCAAIRDLCTYAVDRLQKHVDPVGHTGVNVLAAVSQGTEHGTYLCRQGMHLDKAAHPERCAPGAPLYNQTWGLRWPISVTMWKFDGTNLAEVTRVMTDWRQSSSQHLPNIQSPAPAPGPNVPTPIPGPRPEFPVPHPATRPHQGTGWGPGGSVVGKALPCDDIPDAFKYQPPFPQDTNPPGYTSPTGRTYLEDALDYWSHTPGVPMPESQCDAQAQKLCAASKAQGGAVECGVCAALHMRQLTGAGCTSTDVAEYCAAPPAPDADVWSCAQCQHVYNPATDDTTGQNTPFEQLPASWRCPICGAAKSAYHKRVDAATGEAQWVH
jgi:rubredoxin